MVEKRQKYRSDVVMTIIGMLTEIRIKLLSSFFYSSCRSLDESHRLTECQSWYRRS